MTVQQEANFQPHHNVSPLTKELRLFLLAQTRQALRFTCFCFSSLQPKGFRRYYSSPLLIHEQFGCIKEVMPIGRFWLLFHSVFLWQCSAAAAADFQPWYLPSAAVQLLSVTGCPPAISGKDHSKDTKLEEERVCSLCVSLKTLYAYLLTITLLVMTTTWDQGRNLEVKKQWNTEMRVWEGKKKTKTREIKTPGGYSNHWSSFWGMLLDSCPFSSIFLTFLGFFPYWSYLHIVLDLERPLFPHCNTRSLKRNILKWRS